MITYLVKCLWLLLVSNSSSFSFFCTGRRYGWIFSRSHSKWHRRSPQQDQSGQLFLVSLSLFYLFCPLILFLLLYAIPLFPFCPRLADMVLAKCVFSSLRVSRRAARVIYVCVCERERIGGGAEQKNMLLPMCCCFFPYLHAACHISLFFLRQQETKESLRS